MTYDQQSFGVLFKKRIIAVIFLGLLGFGFSHPQELNQSNEWKSELISMLSESNKLYSEGKGDLSLAANLLKTTAFHGATDYYRQANLFYFFSLKKSSFDENPDALEKEDRQIIPLLDEPEKKKWEALIQNKDDALVPEINQFWQSSDPVVSTTFNERLFEHWFRIAFAQKHFTNNTNSPYGTDDRGTIFVRFGPPDLNIHKSYSPKQVVVPSYLDEPDIFDLTMISEEIEFSLWEYIDTESNRVNQYYLFGKNRGRGEYGIRKDPVELLSMDQVNFKISRSPTLAKAYSKLLVYELFEQLAPYHTDYSQQFSSMTQKIFTGKKNSASFVRITGTTVALVKNPAKLKKLVAATQYYNTSNQRARSQMRQKRTMQNVGPSATKLINEESKLESDYTVFRFWDNESQPEYIIAIKPMLNSKNDSLISDSLFTNNIVSSYDSSGDPSNRSKKLKPLSPKPIEATSIFRLNSSKSKSAYYNIDVIDPSQPNMILPAQLGLSPRVKQTTGQHKIDFPSSLSPSQKSFTISDIIVGKSQEMKQDNRIPIVPTFNRSFKQDEKMLLFFETYNLPKGGYKFEYYFERKRTIFRDKKVEEKPSVTILLDKVDGRDQQLFSINLSDLKPSKYNLVFTFSALSGNTGSVQTKRIELEVTD